MSWPTHPSGWWLDPRRVEGHSCRWHWFGEGSPHSVCGLMRFFGEHMVTPEQEPWKLERGMVPACKLCLRHVGWRKDVGRP